MSGLYEGGRLEKALGDARRRTLSIYGHLDLDRLEVPYLAIVNPPLWELAHIAWFQEFWCLRYRPDDAEGLQVRPVLANADGLVDSRIVPHADRWTLPIPRTRDVLRYLDETLERSLERLRKTPEDERYFFRLALLHEDMHGEALLMTLQTLGLPAPALGEVSAPVSVPVPAREVAFDGGEFLQGSVPENGHFVFDNEKWAHMVSVRPFAMSISVATKGEFVAFTEEGGYRRPEFWSAAGWKWRTANMIETPHYWKRSGSGWLERRYDHWRAIDLGQPMVHVSLHEAVAFCRWAERRLPTEAEWEFAARSGGTGDRYPWGDATCEASESLDLRYHAPSTALADPQPSRTGLRQLLGGVWEWTSSAFQPYPGFRADPYKEYSEPWFETHHVLRGGSFATRSRLVHNRFRNFYLPERRDVFNGIRTCALETA